MVVIIRENGTGHTSQEKDSSENWCMVIRMCDRSMTGNIMSFHG